LTSERFQMRLTVRNKNCRFGGSGEQRPPLSKAFLSGNAEVATLEFRSAEHYERERITVLTGQRVTRVRLELDRSALGG
jgi:hypothetical protein